MEVLLKSLGHRGRTTDPNLLEVLVLVGVKCLLNEILVPPLRIDLLFAQSDNKLKVGDHLLFTVLMQRFAEFKTHGVCTRCERHKEHKFEIVSEEVILLLLLLLLVNGELRCTLQS